MHHSGSAVKTNILSDLHRFEECRKQNEQYSRIIAKQELMIKDLNKKLTHLSNENEKLSKHNEQLEALIKQSIPELGNHNSSHVVPHIIQDSPAPPPKSPYRAHNYSKTHENGSQSFSPSKRPPELKLVSSNYSPSKSNSTNSKQIIAPQYNSPQLPAGLPNSDSRSNFSHRDLQEKTHNETTKPFQEKKGSNENSTAPSTPMLPRTPRFDSLMTPALNTTALNNLNNIHVDVISSTVRIDEKSKEIPLFTFRVCQECGHVKNELWRIEKSLHDIQSLDKNLKDDNPGIAHLLKKLPEKSLIIAHAPAKVDERKRAIEGYLQHAISLRITNATSLREFLSSEVTFNSPKQEPIRFSIKEGYLTKRRKNIGGWILRYYVLCDGGLITYYESKDGQLLGTINLKHSQIENYTNSESHDYRHAFIVLEHKRPHYLQKHILCANSDDERDEWVAYLNRSVQQFCHSQDHSFNEAFDSNESSVKSSIRTSTEFTPTRSSDHSFNSLSSNDAPSPRASVSDQTGLFLADRSVSGRRSSKKIAHRHTPWSKQSIESYVPDESLDHEDDPSDSLCQVFGVPLEEAVTKSKIYDRCVLPAIIFRCIDYLESKDALSEEGIYRMSGSNLEIRNLKRRFNNEGDVNLLEEKEDYDIHAIAGLLKMWLRELPENILTEHLLRAYLENTSTSEHTKIEQISDLVSLLPLVNYTLLRFLCAHLVRVIQNANRNRMTLGNICVIFSATLAIPSHILQMMLMKFNSIFWTDYCCSKEEENNEEQTFPTEDTLKIYMQDIDSQEYVSDVPLQKMARPSLQNKNVGQSNTSIRSSRNNNHYHYNTPEHFVSLEKKLEEIDDDSFLYDEDSYYFSEGEFEVAYFASRSSANSKYVRNSS